MLTEKDFCDYDTCVALKELGYPIDWFEDETYHENSTNLQLYEAQKFLRAEHDLHIEVRWYYNMWYEYEVKEAEGKVVAEGSAFPTYEDALSTAVRMGVEHLKEKQDGRM